MNTLLPPSAFCNNTRMSTDRDALLAAIRTNADEDTPRLMFADWLDENDDPDRAEFVRVQCELARLTDDGGDSQPLYEFLRDRDFVTRPTADWTRIDDGIHRRLALSMRAADLLKRHAELWTPQPPKGRKVTWHGFHRGFPERVTLPSFRGLKRVAAHLRAAAPTVTLVADEFAPEHVEQLAEAGLLTWVSGLDLRDGGGPALRALGHRPEAAGVRSLRLRYGGASDVASALADGPHWTGLRELDLRGSPLDPDTAEALFRAPHLRTLRRLDIHGDAWTARTVGALAAGKFADLTHLRLSGCGLDDDAAEALAAGPDLARLRNLDLDHNNLTGRGVTALLCSPHLTNVAFLGLEQNPSTGLDAKRLAALAPAGLRMFHAHGCRLSTADVRALARCPRLRTLWYLDLDDNALTTAAVRALVKTFRKWCPPILWLTHNRIDDRGADLLANWEAARALRVLHTRFNDGMTDAGARVLLDSPHLADIDGLGVDATGDELKERLKARFRRAVSYY